MGKPEKKRPSNKRAAGRKPSVADDSERSPAEKPISLAPLEFEEALRGLLKVKPDKGSQPSTKEKRDD